MMRRLDGPTLVLATHNAGKLAEIVQLFAPFPIKVVSAATLGLPEPAETESSFAGNARIKAHAAAQATSLPALSDDSGIQIDALGGAPGVYTADWAETGQGRDFMVAMTRAWTEVQATGSAPPHRARFVSTLCLAWPDGQDRLFTGSVDGTLTWPPRGKNGFGFDPMFVPDGHSLSFGEMEPAQKQELSHRTLSFRRLIEDGIVG